MQHIGWALDRKNNAARRIAAAFAGGVELTIGDVVSLAAVSRCRVDAIVREPLYVPVGKRGNAVLWRKAGGA